MPWIRGQTKQPAGKGTREKERERETGFQENPDQCPCVKKERVYETRKSVPQKANLTLHILSFMPNTNHIVSIFLNNIAKHMQMKLQT